MHHCDGLMVNSLQCPSWEVAYRERRSQFAFLVSFMPMLQSGSKVGQAQRRDDMTSRRSNN